MKDPSPRRRRALGRLIAPILFVFGLGFSFTGTDPQLPILRMPTPVQQPTERKLTPDQVPPGALVPAGPPPPLAFFGTGDVVGYLEPCG